MTDKERQEREHSEKMNDEAVAQRKAEAEKQEPLTQAEADRIESAFFEDDEKIMLRDGKTYTIPPCTLKQARRLMQLLKKIDIDFILVNFVPTGDAAVDNQREDDLFEVLSMAFVKYPNVNKNYMEEIIDVKTASKIVGILVGINGLKK